MRAAELPRHNRRCRAHPIGAAAAGGVGCHRVRHAPEARTGSRRRGTLSRATCQPRRRPVDDESAIRQPSGRSGPRARPSGKHEGGIGGTEAAEGSAGFAGTPASRRLEREESLALAGAHESWVIRGSWPRKTGSSANARCAPDSLSARVPRSSRSCKAMFGCRRITRKPRSAISARATRRRSAWTHFQGSFSEGKSISWRRRAVRNSRLLPPDNATGNFTKIVQRVPVKIVLDAGQMRTSSDCGLGYP